MQHFIFEHCVHGLSPPIGAHAPPDDVLLDEVVVDALPVPWPHADAQGPLPVVQAPKVLVALEGLPHIWKHMMKLPGWAV